MNNIQATFKFYTKNKERLSIFYIPDRKELVIFKCSKKDIFKKRTSWEALAEYLNGEHSAFNPQVMRIDFGEKYMKEFMNFCRNSFYIRRVRHKKMNVIRFEPPSMY